MARDRILGSVFLNGGVTLVRGDEAQLQEYLEGLDDETREASLKHLARAGAIRGFGAPDEVDEPDPTLQARKGMGVNSFEDEEDDTEHRVVQSERRDAPRIATGDEDEDEDEAEESGEEEAAPPTPRRKSAKRGRR